MREAGSAPVFVVRGVTSGSRRVARLRWSRREEAGMSLGARVSLLRRGV